METRADVDAKLLNHGDQQRVLVFEMAQNHLDLPLSPDIHIEIVLGTHFPVAAHQVLANHDQRHEQNLNHIRNEQPEHKGHRRIELPCRGARTFQPNQQTVQPKMARKNPIEPTRTVIQSANRSSGLNVWRTSLCTLRKGRRRLMTASADGSKVVGDVALMAEISLGTEESQSIDPSATCFVNRMRFGWPDEPRKAGET